MANFVFGQAATGRVGGYADRVLNNDPADSDLIAVVLSQSGTAEQAEALTTLAAVEADANFAEATTGTTPWTRQTLAGLAYAWDAVNNRNELDFNDLIWTPSADAPDSTGLLICYIPDNNPTGGISADSAVIPLLHLDFVAATDGNQITYQVNAEGAFNATRV